MKSQQLRSVSMYCLKAVLLLILLTGNFTLSAQQLEKREKFYNLNMPSFDFDRKYHFGFILGVNQSDFIIDFKPDPSFANKLVILKNQRQPGFNLGIVSNYRLTKNVHFRFVPTLSFQDRKLSYTFQGGPDSTVTFDKIVECTFVELPIFIKLRTDRIGNVALYAIGGGKFMLDMTNKKLEEIVADKDVIVRTKKQQLGIEFGGGADFFLPYFKFGIELKMAVGVGNVLINDNTRFTHPLNGLTTKGYVLTFTFEG